MNAGTAHNDSRNANTATTDIINLILPITFARLNLWIAE
jgi:hypothetical protein